MTSLQISLAGEEESRWRRERQQWQPLQAAAALIFWQISLMVMSTAEEEWRGQRQRQLQRRCCCRLVWVAQCQRTWRACRQRWARQTAMISLQVLLVAVEEEEEEWGQEGR